MTEKLLATIADSERPLYELAYEEGFLTIRSIDDKGNAVRLLSSVAYTLGNALIEAHETLAAPGAAEQRRA